MTDVRESMSEVEWRGCVGGCMRREGREMRRCGAGRGVSCCVLELDIVVEIGIVGRDDDDGVRDGGLG